MDNIISLTDKRKESEEKQEQLDRDYQVLFDEWQADCIDLFAKYNVDYDYYQEQLILSTFEDGNWYNYNYTLDNNNMVVNTLEDFMAYGDYQYAADNGDICDYIYKTNGAVVNKDIHNMLNEG